MSKLSPRPPVQLRTFEQHKPGRAMQHALMSTSMTLLMGLLSAAEVSANEFPAVLELSDLNGTNGFVINGINAFARESGSSVSDAGDVNGDGVADLLLSAPFAFGSSGERFSGETYVVFGDVDVGSAGVLELFQLNGSNGFVINGINRDDLAGWSVSSAGDVNADGVDDLLIGAIGVDTIGIENAGASYVVFGSGGIGGDGSFNLSDVNGANGFVINGAENDERSGWSVSKAGDVNGDGTDDLVIGATAQSANNVDAAGASYVVFGGSGLGSTGTIELSNLDGNNGFIISGIDTGDLTGDSVSNAGDVNGDGVDDLLIGASDRTANGIEDAGASFVVFGGSDVGSSGLLALSDLDGTNGFIINGVDRLGALGTSVSGAGDVNGDGVSDLLVGAPRAVTDLTDRPETYVVFGGNGVGSTGVLDVTALDGSNGFVINGIARDDRLGDSVSNAGDVNGDGLDDLLIGAPGANSFAGESYLIFGGSNAGSTGVLNLSDLNADDGIVFKGIDASDKAGSSVSGAGDVNGDGVDDLLIGAPEADPTPTNRFPNRDSAGETYVVFGVAMGQQVLCNGLPITVDLNLGDTPSGGDDVILGTPGNDTINAFGGNDTICGEGGDDIITAGRGNDWVSGGAGNDVIRGNAGDDALYGEAGDDSLMGDSGNDRILGGAGIDDIDGGLGDDTIFTGQGATVGSSASVKGNDGADTIFGGTDADDIRGNEGADRLFGRDGNDTINGGPDDDRISGGSGDDVLSGGMGNDLVQGGVGDDLVRGDIGNDMVRGGAGNDTVLGGSGDDFLVGGTSSGDVCNGQEGSDTAASSCESLLNVP